MTLIIPSITKWKKGDITIQSTKTIILTFPQTPTPVLILEEDYEVDFNHQNSIAKVFGFTIAKYTERFHESENVLHILSINSILVKIIELPDNLVYLAITLDVIDSLAVSITDQDDHLLNLRNEKLTIRFHSKEAR